jgi:hypothetical protein
MPLAASQIVTLATQIAKCPSFTTQGGQFLNSVLADLCQDYDLVAARGITSFVFQTTSTGSGPYALGVTDWLRANRNDVFYTIDGVKYVMIGVEMAEYDALVQQAGLNAYPENYAVDNSAEGIVANGGATMYVWPPAAGAWPVTARYQRQMPDLTLAQLADTVTVPWFPNQNYLITKTAALLMQITNDDRKDKFDADAEHMVKKFLTLQDESDEVAKTVTLDRRRFGTPWNRVKNTKRIGW